MTKLLVSASYPYSAALGIAHAYALLHPQATIGDIRAALPLKKHPARGFVDLSQATPQQLRRVVPNCSFRLPDKTEVGVDLNWDEKDLCSVIQAAYEGGIEMRYVSQVPQQAAMKLPNGCSLPAGSTTGYALQIAQPESVQPQIGSLVNCVEEDIEAFFAQPQELFFSERDLQLRLGNWLASRKAADGQPKYQHVFFEYPVDVKLLPGIRWGTTRINIDIVVKNHDEYIPIELKYATKSIKGVQIPLFGTHISEAVNTIKDQDAIDIICYNSWKDVSRIELLQKYFSCVPNGIALLLTNVPAYRKGPTRPNVNYENFALDGDRSHGTDKSWLPSMSKKIVKSHPSFNLLFQHTCLWREANITWQGQALATNFEYNIIKIKSQTQ